jgi:hypothetical protein
VALAIVVAMASAASAQGIQAYSGFIERKSFHTWSETPTLAGNAKSTTDFTETQTTVVRIERGKVTATYQVDYSYGVKSSNSGAFMDGRCPVSTTTMDEEIQYFPEQGIPAEASLRVAGNEYSLGVEFKDNAVGVRTTRADRILAYNRGAKGCPDNPDKFYSDARDFIRAVNGIRIEKQKLGTGDALAGSVITPGETQYWVNLQVEFSRLERERNAVAKEIQKATPSTPQAQLTQLVDKRNALTRQLRELAEKNMGSPVFPLTGKGMDPQAFASSGCGTRG